MDYLPYLIAVSVCCVPFPLGLVLGIAIGKYGAPVVWNPSWRAKQKAKPKPKTGFLGGAGDDDDD